MNCAPTPQDLNFHPQEKLKYGDAALVRGVSRGLLTQNDADLIKEYVTELQVCRNISNGRVLKYIYTLINWQKFLTKPYAELKIGDVGQGILAMKSAEACRRGRPTGRPMKQNTQHDYVIFLKAFLLWLVENEYSDLQVNKIQKFRAPSIVTKTTTPDEIFTPDEVLSLITAGRNSRDRAIIATLYDSGCRVGELARMTWKDISFDEYGCGVHIHDTKNSLIRYARLGIATEYLAAWKRDYPFTPEGNALVFLSKKNRPIIHQVIMAMLKRTRLRSGVTKHVRPHLFRKSRATHIIEQNYQESVIKEVFWGNKNTKMFETYVVLSKQDIDAEFLDKMGIRKKHENREVESLQPVPCPYCHFINGPRSNFCAKCGRTLTENAAVTLEESTKIAAVSREYQKLKAKLDELSALL